ncbi:MAG: aminotransferase class I/II-fold pyridoxal phosphate-dependent enzyme [Rhodospirillales bacterium]|nr:aminotransferase class I/II-fold pyridoxal phosphate-dependent enzyme [Alphaproteobacteria bacterium]USO03176.1 MAG: aminotransferase class I/II-fold pyridoxal phosphate-dependent enzyme [Rhodospirillales bacterium]
MNKIERAYAAFIDKRQEKGLFRQLQDVSCTQSRFLDSGGQTYLNLSSNDYLGLRFHPELIGRANVWSEKYGAGSGASRLVTGNLEVFAGLEKKVADLKGKEAALIMGSGFLANASVLPALFDSKILGDDPDVFSDRLNHASMHIGCAVAGVRQIRYRHNDMAHLASLLEKYKDSGRPKFILTESVFSMDGDIAPLSEINVLAERYGCFVICDEAHATGVLGLRGRGLAMKADLVIGTFSKAMGSFGAYIACSEMLKTFLVNRCAGLIYASALPPSVLGAIDAALDLVPGMPAEREHVAALGSDLRKGLRALGFETGQSATHIVPVIVGSAERSLDMSARLKKAGIWAGAIRPPTVPENEARIRFALSSVHTHEDLDRVLNVLDGKEGQTFLLQPSSEKPPQKEKAVEKKTLSSKGNGLQNVVFVHGWGFQAGIWMDVADRLKGANKHFVDLGFIKGFENSTGDIPENSVVIGHSLGVMWLLRQRKKSFKGLVSISGFDCFFKHRPVREIEAMKKNLARKPWRQMQEFWKACGTSAFYMEDKLNVPRLEEGLEWLATWDERHGLGTLACPAMVLAAKDDRIVPEDMTRAIWGDYNLRWSDSGGHVLPLNDPGWCAWQIQEFLDGL